MTPFNGYCAGAGVAYEASGSYRYLRAARGGKRISPFLAGQIKDPRILELIGKGDFDYVVLVTRFSALATAPGARAEFSAFRKMHEHIVRSGARTVVSVSYVTRGSVHDRGRKANNRARHEELKTELNGMEIAGKKHPVILVPTGSLWSEGGCSVRCRGLVCGFGARDATRPARVGVSLFHFHNGAGSPEERVS